MASIEAEDLETQQQNVENNLQPFFVLHKASSQKKGRKLGGKNRRKIEISESEAMAVEGGESEEQLFEDLRMEAFDIVWSKTQSTIKDVLRKINLDVFTEIDQWVHESFDAISSQGRPDFAKVTCSYPIVTDAKSKQLFTGLVFTRNIEFVDDLLTFADLGDHLKSHGCHVAKLSSLDFSLKGGVSSSIRSLLRKFLMVSLDAADISILASWYSKQQNYENPVVVIIEDLERCCGTVLSDFILMLSEWVVKIPIILIMGLATTIDAPRNILSTNALQCLSPHKFVFGSPAERLDAIISAVLVRRCSGFTVGHKVATFLRNCFLRQDGTLSSLVRGLKMAIILHFSMEPLSFVLKYLNHEDYSQGLLIGKPEAVVEMTFKRAFDLPSCTRSKVEEPNGEFLDQGLSEMQKLQNLWSTVLLCLYEAGKYHKISMLDLYCEALDPDVYKSGDSDSHLNEKNFRMPLSNQNVVSQHANLHIGGFICQAIRKVRELSPVALCQLLESWEKRTEGVNEIHEKVKELQSLSKLDHKKNLKRELTDISRRHTTRNNINIEKDVKTLNEKASTLIGCMVRDYMQPIERVTLHEMVCFRNIDKLQSTLIGDPRRRIQADLLEPHKFLKCSCCRKSGNAPLPSMHDTSIMYALAQEHGDLINLHDWYKSFKTTICVTNKGCYKLKQSPSKKRKHAIEPQLKSEASLQARFCRAVMELQITGLLRMPSKRRPDYVQRVAFGL